MHANRQPLRMAVLVLLCLGLLLASACAAGNARFQKRLDTMSDMELTSYYKGINDRVRDLNDEYKRNEEREGMPEDEHWLPNPSFVGGPIYDLERKRKLVLKEMEARGLKP